MSSRLLLLGRRGLLLGLLTLLLATVALTVAAAEPVGGQGHQPLECDGGLYLTTGSPDDMTLTRVDRTTGGLTPVGGGGLRANALGHNPLDDFLYGMGRDDHHVVRLGADGSEEDLGVPTGVPSSWELTYVGTFLPDGHYLVLGDDAPAGTPAGTDSATWAEIDLGEVPPRVVRTFGHPTIGNNDLQDVAYNPVDGLLYGHSRTRDRLVRIDPATGAATAVGPAFTAPANAGAVFFDAFGRLWLYGSGAEPSRQDTLYRIDEPGTSAPVVVAQGPTVTNADGASCPFNLAMDKTVTPTSACAGEVVTYRYTVTNQAMAPGSRGPSASFTFVDTLPDDGRTFVADSLVDPLGGIANAYGGGRELRVEGLALAQGETATLAVDVALPATMTPGTVTNQARLVDLTGDLGGEVRSEFPGTPEFPDPTPLEVRACPDLGITKEVDATLAGPGDRLTYTLRVTNHGPGRAAGIDSVADTLPPGVTFVAASDQGTVQADGVVRWPAFALDEGDHRDLTVTVLAATTVRTATEDDGRLDNTALVAHPDDPDPTNDRDTAAVPVDTPDLVVTKDDGHTVVDPGQDLTYRITVHNEGTGDAHGVVVTDRLPAELAYEGGSEGVTYTEPDTVSWPAFDLAAGATRTLTVEVTVADDLPAGTEITNVAVADHPDDRDPDDNRDDDRDEVDGDDPAPTTTVPPAIDEPRGWLPRTGGNALPYALIGAGLVLIGLALRWWGRARPT